MKQLVASYEEAFPDAHFVITHLFADENQVAIRYEVTATQQGEMFEDLEAARRNSSFIMSSRLVVVC